MGELVRRDLMAFAGLVLVVLALRGWLPPYDDAFFFVRFARNVMEHGVFAWNVADGPVYGNTSQLFQIVVAAVHGVAGEYTVALTRGVLAACLVGAVAALRAVRPAVVLMASPVAFATVVSGMETATVLLLGSLFLAECARPQPRGVSLTGLSVLLYLARPDVALLVVVTLAMDRRWRVLVASLLGIAACLLTFALVYGTPVPLSFLTKSGISSVYDDTFLSLSLRAKGLHFALFAWVVVPWLRWHPRLVPVALFVAYHLFGNVDVMGLHARFYAPVLPWIAVAAASAGTPQLDRRHWAAYAAWLVLGAVLVMTGSVPGNTGWVIARIAPVTYAAYALAVGVALSPLRWGSTAAVGVVAVGLCVAHPKVPEAPQVDDVYVARLEKEVTSFRGLRRLARCLGTQLHVMHSEIGAVGMVLRDGTVTDLGGLMSHELALGEATLQEVCLRDPPDAIFLPHRNYARLNEELQQGTCLHDYTRVVRRSSSPLHVRKDLLRAYHCKGTPRGP